MTPANPIGEGLESRESALVAAGGRGPAEFLKFPALQPIDSLDATSTFPPPGAPALAPGCFLLLMKPSTPLPNRTTRLGLIFLSFSLLAALPRLGASPIHAPHAPYSVQVGGSSTIFDSVVGFNGSRSDFGTSWGSTWDASLQNFSSGWQTFTATFLADPGSVFTSAHLNFGQWSFAVPEGGWLWFEMNWTLPGGTYLGNNNVDDTYYTSRGGTSWAVGSGQGNYQYWHWGNQGGGGFEFMPIMDWWSPVLLNNVSSFTVSFSARILHGGAVFGSGTGAGLGFSAFQVTADTVPGAPPPPAVPDAANTLILLGAGLLSLLGAGRVTRRVRCVGSP